MGSNRCVWFQVAIKFETSERVFKQLMIGIGKWNSATNVYKMIAKQSNTRMHRSQRSQVVCVGRCQSERPLVFRFRYLLYVCSTGNGPRRIRFIYVRSSSTFVLLSLHAAAASYVTVRVKVGEESW